MLTIYSLSSSETPENIRYVGKTNNLKKRLKHHISIHNLKKGTFKDRWIKKELLLGNKILINTIEEVNEDNWQEKEIYWIAKYKELGFKLTNTTLGGICGNFTKEIKDKISSKRISKNLENKKEEIEFHKIHQIENRWFGKRNCIECEKEIIHSGTTLSNIIILMRKSLNKKCLSCKRKERVLTQETKDKISLSKQNLSQETRDKFSKLHKGKTISIEVREKLRQANLGKKHSEESKKKRIDKLGTKILCLNNNIEYLSIKEASRELNCSPNCIKKVLIGERENTKGYKFIYKNEENEENEGIIGMSTDW